MRRGEVWWADLPQPWGRRPVLLLARNEAYDLLNGAVAAPLSTRLRGGPTMVRLDPAEDGVPETCVANLDALHYIPLRLLGEQITRLRPSQMERVDNALRFALRLRD